MKKIIIGVIILGIIVGSYFGLKAYADKQFVSSINNVEKDRDAMMTINKKYLDLMSQVFTKADSLKLFTDEKVSYDTRISTLKEIQSNIEDSSLLDNELSVNAEQQVKEFNNIQKLSFILSKNNKNTLSELKQVINQELENNKSSAIINKQEAYLVLNLFKVSVDESLLAELNNQKDIPSALASAAPYQKYTSNTFAFENEELYRTDYPQPTEALKNSKEYFADYYNMLLAANSGDNQKAKTLYDGLNSKGNVMDASLQNSLDFKNPKWKNIYQSEISDSDKYIQLVAKSKKVTLNTPRESAYYIFAYIQKVNDSLDKVPKAANFQELKTQLNLKYGSSDYIKYTSSGETSFILEYLDKTTNQWIKLELKG